MSDVRDKPEAGTRTLQPIVDPAGSHKTASADGSVNGAGSRGASPHAPRLLRQSSRDGSEISGMHTPISKASQPLSQAGTDVLTGLVKSLQSSLEKTRSTLRSNEQKLSELNLEVDILRRNVDRAVKAQETADQETKKHKEENVLLKEKMNKAEGEAKQYRRESERLRSRLSEVENMLSSVSVGKKLPGPNDGQEAAASGSKACMIQ